jgi:hypothetical protein
VRILLKTAVFTIAILAWLSPCHAQDRILHTMLHDLTVSELPALNALDAEVASDPNALLWWLHGRKEYVVESVVFEDPLTGTALPTRTQGVESPKNCYALMIDDSLSMRPFWANAVESMKRVLALVPETDHAGLYSFSEDLELVHPYVMVGEMEEGEAAIDGIRLEGLDTQLYLALLKVYDDLAACPGIRGHVIMFSDGDAEDMARTLQDALGQAQEQRVTNHTVGFAPAGRTGTALKMEILRTLSGASTGRYHFYEDMEGLEQAFAQEFARHRSMGVALPLDLHTLAYGQGRLTMLVTTTDLEGAEHVFRVDVPITGTETMENFLVSVSRKFGGINPWLVLLSPLVALVLLGGLFLFLRRRRLNRRAAEIFARQQAEEERLEKLKAEAEQRDAGLQDAIQQVAQKVDEFKPRDKVMEQGEPFGWLVDLTGKAYELITYSTRIGRSEQSDVVLADPHVSSEHAILDFKRGVFIWTDRAPMNPTVINGEPVQGSREIRPDDVILCGDTQLQFVLQLVEGEESVSVSQ